MVVPSIILITIVVFIAVDLLLRILLDRLKTARARKEREQALDAGLRLDVSEEAPTLVRVDLDRPTARILAVDDEKVVLDSFRKMLVLGGYSIDTVQNGAEVLGLIRKHDYDFVFTDLRMPGMDGVEVTKAVKHLRPDIDVIVITGYASIDTAVETVKFGATDYVEKPFTEDELLGFVRTAWLRRQARLEKQQRHRIRLVRPGTGESKSRFELNVPAGVFVSPQHAWARIELNGTVQVGPDDLIRKVFGHIDRVAAPVEGRRVERGDPLFSLFFGDYELSVPAPVSGRVTAVNDEHAEHPEWLTVKPFELCWICRIEPSNLAAELADLRIGGDAVDWYQDELDRYGDLTERREAQAAGEDAKDSSESEKAEARARLVAGFAREFQQ